MNRDQPPERLAARPFDDRPAVPERATSFHGTTAGPSGAIPHTGAGISGALGLFAVSAIAAGAGAILISRRIS